MALYIPHTAFSIWRGFCMSGRKLLDPTAYIEVKLQSIIFYTICFVYCYRYLPDGKPAGSKHVYVEYVVQN